MLAARGCNRFKVWLCPDELGKAPTKSPRKGGRADKGPARGDAAARGEGPKPQPAHAGTNGRSIYLAGKSLTPEENKRAMDLAPPVQQGEAEVLGRMLLVVLSKPGVRAPP